MTQRQRHANQPKPKSKSPAKRQPTQARPTQPALPLPLAQFQMTATVEQFSGPIPPPETLASYDTVVPGLAAEIVEMAHDEQRFRHRIAEKAVDANIASDKRGQRYALAIAVIGLIVAAVVTIAGYPYVGGVIGGASLATIVGLFLKQQRGNEPPAEA